MSADPTLEDAPYCSKHFDCELGSKCCVYEHMENLDDGVTAWGMKSGCLLNSSTKCIEEYTTVNDTPVPEPRDPDAPVCNKQDECQVTHACCVYNYKQM